MINRISLLRFGAIGAVGFVGLVAVAGGGACDIGGEEGDRCNPLVLRDECHDGLSCKAATCTESYCCPVGRPSTDPHCNGEGCPDTDAAAVVDAGVGDGGDAG
jgi:hypothetical protein